MQSWAITTLNLEPHFFKSPLNALAANLRFETKIGLGHGQKGTTWKRGVPATVIWESSAYHRGGYAYRLCGPVKPGEEWKVNEKCFREGHLKFAG